LEKQHCEGSKRKLYREVQAHKTQSSQEGEKFKVAISAPQKNKEDVPQRRLRLFSSTIAMARPLELSSSVLAMAFPTPG
jgi:hypothetical protein